MLIVYYNCVSDGVTVGALCKKRLTTARPHLHVGTPKKLFEPNGFYG
jgi:hypothetical protein